MVYSGRNDARKRDRRKEAGWEEARDHKLDRIAAAATNGGAEGPARDVLQDLLGPPSCGKRVAG